MSEERFSGKPVSDIFSPATFEFLESLAANNNRQWFQDNKQRYEDEVRLPALAFIQAMGPRLATISPHFRADARKTGGSLMRVYRDTRFGKDKTPYKTNIGIQFRHEMGKDVHAPGYYVHISTSQVFIGVGTWHPPSDGLARIRQAIDEQGDLWRSVRDDDIFTRWFTLAGDSLKRPPRGYDKEHPYIDDIKRKDFIAISELAPALVEANDFADISCEYFAAATPLMQFLCRAMRVPF